MRHAFTITKHMEASLSQVIANYLDLEHIPVHSGLRGCEVLAESESPTLSIIGAAEAQPVEHRVGRSPHALQ